MNRLKQLRIEMETERRLLMKRIAKDQDELRDVNERLKVFSPGEGGNGKG